MNSFGDRLWRISAPHFVAGLTETYDGVISGAAPILRWAINKRMAWFRRYCRQKNWTLELIP